MESKPGRIVSTKLPKKVKFRKSSKECQTKAKKHHDRKLLELSFKGLKKNRNHLVGFYRLGFVLTNNVKNSLGTVFERMKPLPVIFEESKEFSVFEEADKKSFLLATQLLRTSIKIPLLRVKVWTFSRLKNYEWGSTKESTPKTTPLARKNSHAFEVLQRSEELCRRVNSLMHTIHSREMSPRQLFPELSLRIPHSVPNSPRFSLQEEVSTLKNTETVFKVFGAWKSFYRTKKFQRTKAKHFRTTYLETLARKCLNSFKQVAWNKNYSRGQLELAYGSYVQRLLGRVLINLKILLRKQKTYQKSLQKFQTNKKKRILNKWSLVCRRKATNNYKVKYFQKGQKLSTLKVFFYYFYIQCRIECKRKEQNEVAFIFMCDSLCLKVIEAWKSHSRKSRDLMSKLQWFLVHNSAKKHLNKWVKATGKELLADVYEKIKSS